MLLFEHHANMKGTFVESKPFSVPQQTFYPRLYPYSTDKGYGLLMLQVPMVLNRGSYMSGHFHSCKILFII